METSYKNNGISKPFQYITILTAENGSVKCESYPHRRSDGNSSLFSVYHIITNFKKKKIQNKLPFRMELHLSN